MPRLLAATAALLLAASLVATSATAQATATFPSPLVSAAWLAEHVADHDVVVLHVAHRSQVAAYDAGHVPGARLLPYERIAATIDSVQVELLPLDRLRAAFAEVGVGDGSRVVLVGDVMSVARAWATLDWLGLGDRAALLDGGMAAWRAGGHPLSTERPVVTPARLSVSPERERFVDAAWVRARLDDPAVALVDARPADEYTGADGGQGGRHAAGHIPGARNLYWERLIVSRDDPRFLPEAELRRLYEAAGATDDRTVVAYCMIGMRASVTYFVSRLLGYETRFYDGSWDDWSRRRLPVVRGPSPGTLRDAHTPR